MLTAQLQTTFKEPEDKRDTPSPVFGSVKTQIDPNKALDQLSSLRFNSRGDRSAGVNERAYEFDAAVAEATGGEVNLEMVSVMKNSMVEKHAAKTAPAPSARYQTLSDQDLKQASAIATGQPIAEPTAEAQKTAQAMSNASPEAIAIAQGIPLSEAQSIALANAMENAQILAQRRFVRGSQEPFQGLSTDQTVHETRERLTVLAAELRASQNSPAHLAA